METAALPSGFKLGRYTGGADGLAETRGGGKPAGGIVPFFAGGAYVPGARRELVKLSLLVPTGPITRLPLQRTSS
jgi:hypothetical protein